VRTLVERLHGCGLSVVLFDCTIDTMVPCYEARIFDDLIPDSGTTAATEPTSIPSRHGEGPDRGGAEPRRLHRRLARRLDEPRTPAYAPLQRGRYGYVEPHTTPARGHPRPRTPSRKTAARCSSAWLGRIEHAIVIEFDPPGFDVSVVRVVVRLEATLLDSSQALEQRAAVFSKVSRREDGHEPAVVCGSTYP